MTELTVVGRFREGSSPTVLLQLLGEDGEAIVQADVEGITYDVWRTREIPGLLGVYNKSPDKTTAPSPVALGNSLDPEVVIFDTLQVGDARWTQDDAGYNCSITFTSNIFPAIPLNQYPNSQYFHLPMIFTFNDVNPLSIDVYLEMLFSLKGKG